MGGSLPFFGLQQDRGLRQRSDFRPKCPGSGRCGYSAGLSAGFSAAGAAGVSAGLSAAGAAGVSAGFSAAGAAGVSAGFSAAGAAGVSAGLSAGFSAAGAAGVSAGFSAGFSAAGAVGLSAGFSTAGAAGLSAGFSTEFSGGAIWITSGAFSSDPLGSGGSSSPPFGAGATSSSVEGVASGASAGGGVGSTTGPDSLGAGSAGQPCHHKHKPQQDDQDTKPLHVAPPSVQLAGRKQSWRPFEPGELPPGLPLNATPPPGNVAAAATLVDHLTQSWRRESTPLPVNPNVRIRLALG